MFEILFEIEHIPVWEFSLALLSFGILFFIVGMFFGGIPYRRGKKITNIETSYGGFPTITHIEIYWENIARKHYIEGFNDGYDHFKKDRQNSLPSLSDMELKKVEGK